MCATQHQHARPCQRLQYFPWSAAPPSIDGWRIETPLRNRPTATQGYWREARLGATTSLKPVASCHARRRAEDPLNVQMGCRMCDALQGEHYLFGMNGPYGWQIE